MTKQSTPNGSAPIETHLGYQDIERHSPDERHLLRFQFAYEPPHGDGVFHLFIDGVRIAGEHWGRNILWSNDGKYLALERKDTNGSTLCLIDMASRELIEVAPSSSPVEFIGQELKIRKYGKPGTETINPFSSAPGIPL